MLRVPQDFEAQWAHATVRVPEACVVPYRATTPVHSARALVTQPTLVLVRTGTKQLQPQDAQHVLTAEAGSVLAMRSGTHVMSEFQGEDAAYSSLIVAVDRGFLSQAVGIPQASPGGPRVVVSTPSGHARQLLERLPEVMASPLPDIERQFKLRELLVAVMADPALRRLLFSEVTDWGRTIEERITSVVTTHGLSPLQVPDMAGLCAMSLSSFKRHFKGVYGTTPGKWLAKARLDHAHSMVMGGGASVSQISEASGYRDVSAFVRAFRRQFGTTPGSLRRQR
ncbi:MAG: AraC family transcriptional regulator [Myxococcota bacterium]